MVAGRRNRVATLALTGFILSGCMNGGFGLLAGKGAAHEPAPRAVEVLSGRFTVSGPHGFCIDESATRDTGEGAFVMLASCAALSGNRWDPKPRRPALLTASVLPATEAIDAAALDRLAAYFSTEEGGAALARSGEGRETELLDLTREEALLLVHAGEAEAPEGMENQYWRAIFPVAGQLVTVTVSGFSETPLSAEAGETLTRAFVAALRKANGAAETAAEAPGPGAPEGDGARGGLASLLSRLL